MNQRTCSIPGCERPAKGRGWCGAHWWRWKHHGDPLGGGPSPRPWGLTLAESFAWFLPGDPPPASIECCWDWPGRTDTAGYGVFDTSNDGPPILAHIASHRLYNFLDPITAENPFVLHWCDRPPCVHPAHLHAGTKAENNREMVERGRSAKGEGHSQAKLTEADVLWIRSQTNRTNRELASIFGVSNYAISAIRQRITWKHI